MPAGVEQNDQSTRPTTDADDVTTYKQCFCWCSRSLPSFQGIHFPEACPEDVVEQGAFPWPVYKAAAAAAAVRDEPRIQSNYQDKIAK